MSIQFVAVMPVPPPFRHHWVVFFPIQNCCMILKSRPFSEKKLLHANKKIQVKTQVQSVEKEYQTATALHTICHVYCILLRV